MQTIQIDDKIAQALSAQAQAEGLTLEQYLAALAERSATPRANGTSSSPNRTAFEIASEMGILGAITDAPEDLSTNPKYLEGLGRD